VLEKSAGGQGASAHAPAAQTAAQPSPAASQPAPGVEASRAVPREGRSVNARWMLGAVVGLVVVMTVLAVVAKRGGKQAEPAAEVSRDRPGNVQSRTEVPTVPDRPVAASGEVAGTRAAPLVSDVTRMGGGRDVSGILAGAVSQGIPKQGLKEITDRANAGLAEAQFELGVINESAEPGNYAEAAKWYKLAASQGYPLADQGVQDALLLRDRGEKALENDLALKRRQSERLRARQAILGKRLNELNDKAMEAIRRIKGG
jgi:TPR repeat protein